MIKKLITRGFSAKPAKLDLPPSVGDARRVYVVGDIHGRADLLHETHRKILADGGSCALEKQIIYLGDYIDRGMESRQVLDALLQTPFSGWQSVFLKGNHEQMLLDSARDLSVIPMWLEYGGRATLASYGVMTPQFSSVKNLESIAEQVLASIPADHLEFIERTKDSHQLGDYYFVHAGVRPGRSLLKQKPEDLLWIREEFTRSKLTHEKFIVHGHTISKEPDRQPNRLGIDTGAYTTGNLTCLVLEGAEQRFL